MSTPDTSVPGEPMLDDLARIVRAEARALIAALPDAYERQWEASALPSPQSERRGSGSISNPTADIALDPRRLALRETVERSRHALFDAAVRLRGVRLALETAVDRFDGEAV